MMTDRTQAIVGGHYEPLDPCRWRGLRAHISGLKPLCSDRVGRHNGLKRWQYLNDQTLSLHHHIPIITGYRQQHEFRAARLNIGLDSRHDGRGIPYDEEGGRVFAKTLLQGFNRALR